MPIPSKFSMGHADMTIVPIDLADYNFSPTSIISSNFEVDSDLTSDQAAVSGYDYGNDFKNDDLEAVLVERGFSQTRLDILSSVEYKAPVESVLDAVETGINETTYSSAAAELMDMQGQLKQLRYSEALEFLSQEMGLHAVDGTLQFEATESSESLLVDSEALINQYNSYMEEAQTVLEWLSKLYKLITAILYSMQVRANSYLDNSNSTIDGIYDSFDDDIVTNKSKGVLSLVEHLTTNLFFRSGFIMDSTDTAVLVQILCDTINRILFPISGNQYNNKSSSDGGEIIGINADTAQSMISILQAWQFSSEFWTVSSDSFGFKTVGFSNSTNTSTTDAASFTLGDYVAMRDLIFDDETGALNVAYLCRIIGSHYILLNSFSRYTLEDLGFDNIFSATSTTKLSSWVPGSSLLTGVVAPSDSPTVINVAGALYAMLGLDPTSSQSNINNISPKGEPGSLILELLTPIGDDGKVLSFNIGTNVPDGTFNQESGKRYLLGELLSANIDESLIRMDAFSGKLKVMKSQLINMLNLLVLHDTTAVSDDLASLNNTLEVSAPIGLNGKTSAASFLDIILDELQRYGSDVAGHGTNLDWQEAVQLWCMLIGAADEEISFLLFKIAMTHAADRQDESEDMSEVRDQYIYEASAAIYSWCTNSDGISVGNHAGTGEYVDRVSVQSGAGFRGDAEDSDIRKLCINTTDSLTQDQIAEALSGTGNRSPLSLCWRAVLDFQTHMGLIHGGSTKAFDNVISDYLPATYYTRVATAYMFIESMLLGSMWARVTPPPPEPEPADPGPVKTGWFGGPMSSETGLSYRGGEADVGAEIWYSKRAGAGLFDAITFLREGGQVNWDYQATLEGNGMLRYDGGCHYDWSGNNRYGELEQIRTAYDIAQFAYTRILEQDVNIVNNVYYLVAAFDRLSGDLDALTSFLKDTDIESSDVNEVLAMIKSDPEFGRLALTSLSRDSLSLNYALKDSLNQANREYPYLPATKATMINQMNDLATISLDGEFMTTYRSGRRRILVVGIPAGAIERLRNAAVDSTANLEYWETTVIKLRIYRRNLIDDSEVMIPKEYIFDTSKFIIEGRSSKPSATPGIVQVSEADNIDAAQVFLDGWTVNDLLDNTTVYSYGVDGITGDTQGDVYNSYDKNYLRDSVYKTIFRNHVNDFYLKLYMMLTLGIDVNEDIFPFLEQEIFFDGPDPGLEQEFDRLKLELGERFPTRDAVSSINYSRLVGELQRSIVFSGKKYRNRILYPKIFDRVFCILIDESDWNDASADSALDLAVDGSTGLPDYESMAFPDEQSSLAADVIKPTYYQFFADMTLMLPASMPVELDEAATDATLTMAGSDDWVTGADAKQQANRGGPLNMARETSTASEEQAADDILSEPQGGAEGKQSYLDR